MPGIKLLTIVNALLPLYLCFEMCVIVRKPEFYLKDDSKFMMTVSFSINQMHNFALFCTEMHCFESPLIVAA